MTEITTDPDLDLESMIEKLVYHARLMNDFEDDAVSYKSAHTAVFAEIRSLREEVTRLRRQPALFRVTIGDYAAEIQVDQKAPPAYHQGMIETVISEVLRRAGGHKGATPCG